MPTLGCYRSRQAERWGSVTTLFKRLRVVLGAAAVAAMAAVVVGPAAPAGAAPACAGGQLLVNPGFESGAVSWNATAGVIGPYSGVQAPHTGTWDAWLDGYGRTHTDSMFQFVTVPPGCQHVTLSFWLHVDTAETANVATDRLVISADGTPTVAAFSNIDGSSSYRFMSFPLNAFPDAMAFSFSGTENATLQTSFLVDDISVTAS